MKTQLQKDFEYVSAAPPRFCSVKIGLDGREFFLNPYAVFHQKTARFLYVIKGLMFLAGRFLLCTVAGNCAKV